jgi:hypothetical protein
MNEVTDFVISKKLFIREKPIFTKKNFSRSAVFREFMADQMKIFFLVDQKQFFVDHKVVYQI